MAEVTHPIIVIGSSAGGWDALPAVLGSIPEYMPASIFVVQHLSSDTVGDAFLKHLSDTSVLPCSFAVDNEPIRPGRVYLAPPDFHVLLTRERIRVTKGPRENSFRPSIDTTFRSAAAHFAAGVIGVILTGLRDDGVEGLAAIMRSGGITMVQDPQNAPFPDMPQAVLNHMDVDFVTRTVEIGLVLSGLIYQPAKTQGQVPDDIANEALIAERVLTSIDNIEQIAVASPFSCPDCGGVLWDVDHKNGVHSYRCTSGHAYTEESLMQLKSKEAEEAMWAALRLLEEQKRMMRKFKVLPGEVSSVERRLVENQHYIDTIRKLLLEGKNYKGQ